ncbi:hypothetical protein NL676_034119 [Syzygium grande]|nr:hypothetical protein NL676_034119 [Syzygium grande]
MNLLNEGVICYLKNIGEEPAEFARRASQEPPEEVPINKKLEATIARRAVKGNVTVNEAKDNRANQVAKGVMKAKIERYGSVQKQSEIGVVSSIDVFFGFLVVEVFEVPFNLCFQNTFCYLVGSVVLSFVHHHVALHSPSSNGGLRLFADGHFFQWLLGFRYFSGSDSTSGCIGCRQMCTSGGCYYGAASRSSSGGNSSGAARWLLWRTTAIEEALHKSLHALNGEEGDGFNTGETLSLCYYADGAARAQANFAKTILKVEPEAYLREVGVEVDLGDNAVSAAATERVIFVGV